MTIYRIAKWRDTFETADSKRFTRLPWVSWPTSFSSNGYQTLIDKHPADAPAMYGAWAALVMLAAQAPERGTLATSRGEAYSMGRITRETGFPAEIFEKLIAWATRPEIGWLEVVTATNQTPPSGDPADAQAPPTSGEASDTAAAQPRPGNTQPATGLPNQTLPNQTRPDERTTARACGRAGEGESNESKIVIDEARWQEATPAMIRIADAVGGKGRRPRAADRELCWRVAGLAHWRFGLPWLDGVLRSFESRREPPPEPWAYFRGAIIKATERLPGSPSFHDAELTVELSPGVGQATTVSRPVAAQPPAGQRPEGNPTRLVRTAK